MSKDQDVQAGLESGGEGASAAARPDAWQLRWVELGVALFLLVVAGLVIKDSLRLGIGWADDGPRSGYFPFRIGLALAACSAWLLIQQLLRWPRLRSRVFAEAAQLRDVAAVLLPTTVFVAAIPWLGMYLAACLLVAWFMWRNGGYRWPWLLGVPLAVSVSLFLLFERAFTQPLPKGPIEHWLGF